LYNRYIATLGPDDNGVTITAAVPCAPDPSAAVAVMVAVPAPTPVTTPVLLTVATAAFDDVHVTALLVAVAGVTVAVRDVVAPTATEADTGDTDTDVTGWVTVTVAIPFFPEPSAAVAVIVTLPAAWPVTTPVLFTVATAAFDELHVTPLSVAFDGVTVAVSVVDAPTWIDADVGLTVTPVTSTGSSVTMTEADPDCPEPSVAVAVIVTVPALMPVTTPVLLTVATPEFDVDQFTALLAASAGATVAVSVVVPPTTTDADDGVTVTDDTGIGSTVTDAEPDFSEPSVAVAVIVTDPTALPVTTPVALTVATAVFDEAHVTVLFVAVAGNTVAVSVVDAPMMTDTDSGLTTTDVTGCVTAAVGDDKGDVPGV